MNNPIKMYLVSYIGVYPHKEGDHTHYLFTNKTDAKRKFRELVKECKAYYEDIPHQVTTQELLKDGLFSLTTFDGDVVDIYIQDIKADGTMYNTIL